MFRRSKTVYVKGMHCDGCVKRVTNALSSIPGVKKCSVNLQDGCCDLVMSHNVDEYIIKERIQNLGFEIVEK